MQQVIAARDFEVKIGITGIPLPFSIATGATFSASITGQTDDIGAFSTDEPIATDNGGNTYDITLSMQQAEYIRLMDAIIVAYDAMDIVTRAAAFPNGKPTHIRDFVENLTISAIWYRRRDVPAKMTIETYSRCSGVEESDSVERRSTETLKTLRFRALGKSYATSDLV